MKKILFIEDESVLQATFGEILEKEGYEVIPATDGETGVRLAKSEIPNLILLDLILPKKNGFEVLKEIKENSETKNIPVIILTNLEESGDVQKAIELGAKNYLVKSAYSLDEVIDKVKKALESLGVKHEA